MSTLYLATDLVPLAAKLADLVDGRGRHRDPFVPATIVVPNRYLGKWLRLWLARQHGIAINLRFAFLESALWDLLRQVDPRQSMASSAAHGPAFAGRPDLLDASAYRLLVLAVLLADGSEDLAPLREYALSHAGKFDRRSARRAWRLADKLSTLIRDYEYHRQDALIQPWIRGELALGTSDAFLARLEQAQSRVFRQIIREPDGLRARLGATAGRLFKTLPQYAMEVWEIVTGRLAWDGKRGSTHTPTRRTPVHVFGLGQISSLHVHTLRWLGEYFDIHLYYLNPLVGRLPAVLSPSAIQQVASTYRQAENLPAPAAELYSSWGRAAGESLWLMEQFLEGDRPFALEVLSPPTSSVKGASQTKPRGAATRKGRQRDTVLERVQKQLLNQECGEERLAQDESLQVVACPGLRREVETVYHSILWNLQCQPGLQQTDIAVAVTDLARYRPALQAMFDRPPQRLRYNLANYSAAGVSTFGQALLGMLDLALDVFTRTKVLEVLLNPCFLARLGVDREHALTWLDWAEKLGIYQGWDERDKQERGYPSSPLFSWRLALQRLRLGRFMETGDERDDAPAPRFGQVLPFADVDSQDREQLDVFSRAVNGLLPTLLRLGKHRGTGASWAQALRHLCANFLEVPEDRPEEGPVRDNLLASLEQLTWWDGVADAQPLALPLIREFVLAHLEGIEGGTGDYLTGGITIAPLLPLRPLPFPIVYVLGLGEDLFPGSNQLSSLDLRHERRLPGDIRPAEQNRFLFLETLLAARQKLYLMYNCRNLQKDQQLLPAVSVLQLERYLSDHVLEKPFEETKAPLHLHDPENLARGGELGGVFAQTERLLALVQAETQERLNVDLLQREELQERRREALPDFSVPATEATTEAIPHVNLKELRGFLENPALASLKRHLRLEDEDDAAMKENEPFVTPSLLANRLLRRILLYLVREAAAGKTAEALQNWPARFEALYEEEELRCHVPEGAFGAVDRAALRGEIDERLHGSLLDFLRARTHRSFCGPLLMGESLRPVGAKHMFPALTLQLPGGRGASDQAAAGPRLARVSGTLELVWRAEEFLDVLLITNKGTHKEGDLSNHMFEPVLFYLALRAHPEASVWLKERDLNLYLSCRDEIYSYTYPAAELTPDVAAAYLAELTADFLDARTYDLLPFEVIMGNKQLSEAITNPNFDSWRRERFKGTLEDRIEDERDNSFRNFWMSPLLDLARASVPDDAFAKVKRRFHLLDIGPRRVRTA